MAKAKTAAELLAALDMADPTVPNLVADLLGSWSLPALYLDAWADTHGAVGVGSAITPTLDSRVMKWFKQLSKQCETGGKNPCIDGTFDDNDAGAQQFAPGKSDAFLVYSERLSFILRQGGMRRRSESLQHCSAKENTRSCSSTPLSCAGVATPRARKPRLVSLPT